MINQESKIEPILIPNSTRVLDEVISANIVQAAIKEKKKKITTLRSNGKRFTE